MIEYIGLHRHSTYSFLDGMGTPAQIAARLQELKQPAGAITDHGTVFGHADFAQAMDKAGLKAIYGCEFYHAEPMIHVPDGKGKATRGANSNAHLTILAKNERGYRNLLALSTASYLDGFYGKPRIDWHRVIRHQEGLVVLSGCVLGQLSKWIINGEDDKAYTSLQILRDHIEHFYVEIIPCPGLDISDTACKVLWQFAEQLKIPRVITDDAHFPRPEDHAAQDAMLCIGLAKTVAERDAIEKEKGKGIKLADYHYHCSGAEILDRAQLVLGHVPEADLRVAIQESVKIAALCDVELPRGKGPIYPVPSGWTDWNLLHNWINEGKNRSRKLGLLPEPFSEEWNVYEDRLTYELEILRHHGFQNYFLLVADIVRWAQKENIFVLARGSAGGSLICWYLGITQLDPIRFGLPVERFIDKSRPDMPDIDLDFDSRHRTRVFAYLTEKYGAAHCAHIAALSTYRAKQSVRDIGRCFSIPGEVVEKVIELVPESLDADEGIKSRGILERVFAENAQIQPLLKRHPRLRLAAKLEGQIRHQTIHAAGFVIDARPLTEVVGIVQTPKTVPVVSVDMNFAQALGLIKVDSLSVDMLAVLAECLELLGKPHNWLATLPLDDDPTYDMLGKGYNTGVFQLQGSSAGRVLQQLEVRSFEEFVAVCGLCRPGPLQSGGTALYVERKHGRAPMPDYHPLIMQHLASKFGIILYQEQVMMLMRDVGGFDWATVHKIRKLISKSGGAQAMEVYRPDFMAHAGSVGVPLEQAEEVFAMCAKSGNYLFNAAHNYEYGMIGYFTAYLKCHHPAQFAACYVKYETDDTRRQRMLQEFRSQGGKFILLDPNRSGEGFRVLDEQTILGGFSDIRGIGPELARDLVARQPYRSWTDFFRSLPPGLREQLQACGVESGQLDLDVVLQIASWFIDIRFNEFEFSQFRRFGCRPMRDLPEIMAPESPHAKVRLMGRLIAIELSDAAQAAKKYGRKAPAKGQPTIRAEVTMADPTGICTITFSPRIWRQLAEGKKLMHDTDGVGDTWIVECSIANDRQRLFADNAIQIRRKAIIDPQPLPGVKRTRRITIEEMQDEADQLQFEIIAEEKPDELWKEVARQNRVSAG